jgi:hypothetical protein
MRFVLALVGFAVLVTLPHAEAREMRIYKPFVVLAGAHSRIDKAEHHRITKQADLEKLWLRHAGKGERAAVPVVDFDRCMIIAVFGGKRPSIAGLYPHFIADGISTVVNVAYASRPAAEAPKQAATTPFGWFIVERWTDRVTVKEFVPNANGQPAKRERRAEFPKLSD